MKKLERRLSRLSAVLGLSWRCARLATSGQKALLPQTIYTSFRQLGGIYVKFLQLMVLRSEAFQTLRTFDIYDVYDRVSTEEIDIRDLLVQELGDRAGQLKLESDMPFAAGSFGQVYLAHYGDKKVILKILRPSVINDLKFDLKVLGFFSRCVDFFAANTALNGRAVHKEFARASLSETNYGLEADYAASLHERYRHHAQLVIPETYRELCSDHIICQDYVDGIAATDLIQVVKQGGDAEAYVAQALGSDLKQQLVSFGSEMLSSIFVYGTAYGDPHPGNIKFLADNKIGLIDFGLQAPAPGSTVNFRRLIQQYYNIYSGQPDIRSYSQVLLDMYGGDVIQAVHSLDDYYAVGSHQLLDSIVNNAEQIMYSQRDQVSQLVHNNKMMVVFNSIINKNNRFCLEYDLDGPEIARAGLLFISLVSSLKVKNAVLQQTYGRVLEITKDVPLREEKALLHPETALEILAAWFDQISYKNPQLYRQLKSQGLRYV